MEHIFSMDGKFFLFINKLTDLIILNFLFFIPCVPVITIGISFCALYQTTLLLANNTESHIIRNYFFCWKQNIKQGILIWIPSLILLTLCFFNLYILPIIPSTTYQTASFLVQIFLLFLLYGILLYAFSLPEAYKTSYFLTLRNATLMTFKYLPFTCLCLCINALPFTLALLFPKITGYILPLVFIIGFSGIAYIHSIILQFSFKKEIL